MIYKNKTMIIDVQPTIEKAKGLEKIRMEMSELDVLYVVKLKNGEQFSTVFSKKSLNEFVPHQKASEMLKSWEQGILGQIKLCEKAIKTGKHPTWKTSKTNKVTGEKYLVAYPLDDYSINNFKNRLEELKAKTGKMEFVKIV